MPHTVAELCLMGLTGVQESDVGDVRKLRAQAARSFGSNRVMAATDLLTVEVRASCKSVQHESGWNGLHAVCQVNVGNAAVLLCAVAQLALCFGDAAVIISLAI